MISVSEKTALLKLIRSYELKYFPDYKEQILSTKAAEALIAYGEAQKSLTKDGWLEKQVKNKCENHIRNIQNNGDQKTKAMAAAIEKEKKLEKKIFDQPRPLRMKETRHRVTFYLTEVPDYQEQKSFYRVGFLALGFECEFQISKPAWEKFLSQVKANRKRPWELAVFGELVNESERGFLLSNAKVEFKFTAPTKQVAPLQTAMAMNN